MYVFPARVGMNRDTCRYGGGNDGVPRASGDEEHKGVGNLFSSETLVSSPVRSIPGR